MSEATKGAFRNLHSQQELTRPRTPCHTTRSMTPSVEQCCCDQLTSSTKLLAMFGRRKSVREDQNWKWCWVLEYTVGKLNSPPTKVSATHCNPQFRCGRSHKKVLTARRFEFVGAPKVDDLSWPYFSSGHNPTTAKTFDNFHPFSSSPCTPRSDKQLWILCSIPTFKDDGSRSCK